MSCQKPPRRGERGSVSLFVVFFAIAALTLAGLLVDLGGAVNAQERAADVAEQAARAAAGTIDVVSLRRGVVAIDQGTACASAQALIQSYASTSGIDAVMSDCVYPSARQVTVYVSVTTTPVISAFFGRFTMRAHESACAEFGISKGVGC